jgi:uncharacterized protein (DUF342 family)
MKIIGEDIKRTRKPVTYDEDVEVLGTIGSGARVRVLGDIAVFGNVEDAEIDAQGRVTIGGGFLGRGRGRIVCGGDFRARFVQRQRVDASGDVVIAKSVVSSTVFSSGDVIVDDGIGSIVGGTVHAYGRVVAAGVGSPRPVMTRIDVGVDPVLALRIEDLEREAMELTRKRIGFLKNVAFVASGTSSRHSGDAVTDMRSAANAIEGDIVTVGERILELRKSARLNPDASVTVRKASYPPLEVSICFSKILNEAPTEPVTFRLLEDRVILDTWNLEGINDAGDR